MPLDSLSSYSSSSDLRSRRSLIYNLGTNVTSWFQLPSRLSSITLLGHRIFLVISTKQICSLEHDGSRVLSNFDFQADEDMETDYPDLNTDGAQALVYPHPHLPDRFFIALATKPSSRLQREGVLPGVDEQSDPQRVVNSLVVREFDGAKHVATYRHRSTPEPPDCETHPDQWGPLTLDHDPRALDVHGLCQTGLSHFPSPRHGNARPTGARSQYRGDRHHLSTTFNTTTRTFGSQQYAIPHHLDARPPSPWNHQVLVPRIPQPGLLHIRRFDASDADFVPSRVSTAEEGKECGEGWSVKVEGLEEHQAGLCTFYHDEDFTVLFIRRLQRYYVWSFVEEEGEMDAGVGRSGSGPGLGVADDS